MTRGDTDQVGVIHTLWLFFLEIQQDYAIIEICHCSSDDLIPLTKNTKITKLMFFRLRVLWIAVLFVEENLLQKVEGELKTGEPKK